jgi:RimJ/RimL family protein N-acetyltransferase
MQYIVITMKSSIITLQMLETNHRLDVATHLKKLSRSDRFLRFGALTSDALIDYYAENIKIEDDVLFGCWRDMRLVGLCHLAPYTHLGAAVCELSMSVDPHYRGRQLASLMLQEAKTQAKLKSYSSINIFHMKHNVSMARVLRNEDHAYVVVQGNERIVTLPLK